LVLHSRIFRINDLPINKSPRKYQLTGQIKGKDCSPSSSKDHILDTLPNHRQVRHPQDPRGMNHSFAGVYQEEMVGTQR
jgi:hypothetical protein